MQRADPYQTIAFELEAAAVREHQLCGPVVRRAQRHASTNYNCALDHLPISVGRPLNLDPVGDDGQRGCPDRWNSTPEVEAGQPDEEKRHKCSYGDDGPGVYQESTKTIPARHSLNLVMDEELRGAVQNP